MGEGIFELITQIPLQTETEGNDLVCTYLIILAVILVALYLGLFIYNKMVIGKKQKQHPCKYCGHMVNAVSKCCSAFVSSTISTNLEK